MIDSMTQHDALANAIAALRPGAQWILRGDDLGGLDWQDTTQERPTDDEINAKATELSAAPPPVVSPRQIRLALTQIGLRQQVEDYVDAQDITVQDSWHYTTEFERTNPLILACAQALGKSDTDLDALFALAATL
jgi:hypothetical protein